MIETKIDKVLDFFEFQFLVFQFYLSYNNHYLIINDSFIGKKSKKWLDLKSNPTIFILFI